MQSDTIRLDNGDFDEKTAFFYIILNGDFKVTSLKFNKKNKTKKSTASLTAGDKNTNQNSLKYKTEAPPPPPQKPLKMLSDGDYFGEIAFMFNCRRTATIKAKQYATVGRLNHVVMTELIRDHPDFSNFIKNDIVKVYDDDLKLFLVAALRRVDYLANVRDEILVQMAYSMNGDIKEKGHVFYDMD